MLSGGCSRVRPGSLLVSCVALCQIWCASASAQQADPEAQTSFGKMVGKSIKARAGTCERYAGIPYAEKPLDQLRFEKPVPWSAPYDGGVLKAFEYQNICVQPSVGPLVRGSEDCLYLNIFKSGSQTNGTLSPVMLWIHGGSFMTGGSDWPLPSHDKFDGCDLAVSQNVIVATTNYRMGPWGFLTTMSDSGDGLDANIGLEDQREAMHWVKQQATFLGGDPGRITIFGESAGAMSVCLHVISPLSAGLFQHAIAESGGPLTQPVDDALSTSKGLATRLGCTSAQGSSIKQCLRNFTSKEILAKAQEHGLEIFEPKATLYFPVVDGRNFREHPFAMLLKKEFNPNVTMILGTNTNESTLFWLPPGGPWRSVNRPSYVSIVQQLSKRFAGLTDAQSKQVLEAYPGSDNHDNHGQTVALTTDLFFLCATRFFAENHPLTYVYRFDHSPWWLPKYMGVPHAIEIPYVFGSRQTAADAALSDEMQANWANLAHQGKPSSHSAGPSWPVWDAAEQNIHLTSDFAINHTFGVEASYRSKQCRLFSEFWREVYGTARQETAVMLV